MNDDPEMWKPVENWEATYEVSNKGRVRSIERVVMRPGSPMRMRAKLRSVKQNTIGYPQVSLNDTVNGRATVALVHWLVAKAFVENPNGYKEIDHIDGTRANNNSDNLQWVTHQENCQRPHKFGYLVRKLPIRDVRLIRAMRGLFKTQEIASQFNVSTSAIKRIWSGLTWGYFK